MRTGADHRWLRAKLEELETIERPSASPGERRAAEWLVAEFAEVGVEARIEVEEVHGTYWWPIGIGTALGVVASLLGLAGARERAGRTGGARGRAKAGAGGARRSRSRLTPLRRALGALLGAIGAAGIASDFPPNGRYLRRLLPKRDTHNVVAELGPVDAEQTVVLAAHHDAAHGGFVFHPALPQIADRFGLIERADTSPPLMAPVVGGPLLGALGSAVGSRLLSRLGLALSLGSTLAMADIGRRRAVPGANDNGTAVVSLIAIAAALKEDLPANTRVILLSTGSEESFSEGMKAFGERHFPDLPRDRTFFCALDTIGSTHLCVLRGEGFLRMREYSGEALDLVDSLAEELGVYLYPNLRLHNGTDGLEPLCAGYPTISMCSCTDLKQPANYHTFNDVAENVDYDTLTDAIRLTETLVRRLDRTWFGADNAS